MSAGPELCLDFLTAIEASPVELARLAAENGCRRIAVMVHPAQGVPDFSLATDTPMRRETRTVCRDLGVAIDLIEGFLIGPETDIEQFRSSLDSGAWLEAASVNVLLRDAELDRLEERLGRFCAVAAGCGLKVTTEWSRRSPFPTPAAAAAFLARVGAPNLTLQLDSLHLFRAGLTTDAITKLPPAIIGRAQLSDGPASMAEERQFQEALEDRMIPGDGELPLAAFLGTLPTGIMLGLEVPMRRLAAIPAAERVRRVFTGARTLLG